ncbi:MAG: ornithine carbamoyltransferase [Clostridia bacterium]|nr:ornithine carbamoyltransferase [Clostridia bacterium]
MKSLLTMEQLSKKELFEILDIATEMKAETKADKKNTKNLEGMTLGMIFQKSSTRTRVSFEVGMQQLGGYPLFLSGNDLQLGRGESIKDTARVFGRYLDGIMIRTFKQSDVEELAEYSGLPIINGLTDYCHPCQVLADLLTIKEHKGGFDGLKACYIGDGNNMANSLLVGCLLAGMSFSIATPEAYKPCEHIMQVGESYGDKFSWTTDIFEAAKDADVIFTDVWASMGQEGEAEIRRKAFAGYCIDEKLLAVANEGCMVQHCLPAHKGDEITEDVFEAHADEIFDEAENRLHAQKAVLWLCMHK